MSDSDIILKDLNPPQHQAVTTAAQYALILAGAGSGKTRVLVHRIAWLLKQGVSPFSILAVTFTNKAAQEMRTRIESITQLSTHRLWIGTFHGLCHRILRQHGEAAHLPENFQILDAQDQIRLVKRLLKDTHIDEKQILPTQAAYFINAHKEAGRRAKNVTVDGHHPKHAFLLQLYTAYEQACERAGLVDFTELLLRVVELLSENKEIRQHFQSRFQHILVDEFQDTNTLQYEWLKLLAGHEGHLFVVGDDDQSIYGWRGANIENIQQFPHDFKKTALIRLEQNYRSTETILSAANALITQNRGRLGKTLWTDQGKGNPLRLYSAFNDIDEAKFIAHEIQTLSDNGIPWSGIAVLYRSNAQSRILEQTFMQYQIPYRIQGGIRFFERAEIKDVLAYLQLIHNHHNDTAFSRIVNVPPRNIGDRTVTEIQTFAKDKGLSLWQSTLLLTKNPPLPPFDKGGDRLTPPFDKGGNRLTPPFGKGGRGGFTTRTHKALSDFLAFVDRLNEEVLSLPLYLQIQEIIQRTELHDYYLQTEGDEKGRMRIENLDELIHAARAFQTHPDESPLASFLAEAALEAEHSTHSATGDAVHLMTVHASKGLEFSYVFICGLEEGLFPHSKSLDEFHQLEEERRLCYVAITRAKQQLTLSHSEKRWWQGREIRPYPSRFLFEIKQELGEMVQLNV